MVESQGSWPYSSRMSLTRLARLGHHTFAFLTLTASFGLCVACVAESPTDDDAEMNDDSPADDPDTDTPDGGLQVVFEGEGVPCGQEKCQDARLVGLPFGAYGCCVDEEESTCGLDMTTLGGLLSLDKPGCEQLNKPGSASDDCPASEPITLLVPQAPPEGTVLEPCCQANGKCGFSADFGNIGFGCVDPSRFGQESGGSCDYAP